MKNEIIEEIMRECNNWKERLLVRLFPNIYINVYKLGVRKGFNWCNKTVQ